ncbi:MAG TPA: adenylate/guanylate cyclase domain-containing protein [Acidimicrobiales bacterium]|nr:adenylate/guanylate cyclase domain-containing protein [Acidimicrobiales bacterium]
MSVAYFRQAAFITAILYALGGLASVPIAFNLLSVDGARPVAMRFTVAAALGAGLLLKPVLDRVPDQRLPSLGPPIIFFSVFMAVIVVTNALIASGPHLGVVAVYFVETPLLCFVFVQRRWAIAATVGAMVGYGVGLFFVDAVAPVQQLFTVLSSAVASSVLVGTMATRVDDSRREEVRAKAELADLNSHLEQRVADQVDELERAGRLRRFLSPQIADVVTSEGADAMLAPHRRSIAAFFVDLRGFTGFTNSVTAERVMRVLDEYYDAVGSVLDEHGATIGGFDGDGVFAYLGDPVPHPDAARAAVSMAQQVAQSLDRLTAEWSGDGGTVGYGIGLAYGEATLGLVGFAGRADYTPVGAVVNMAARLCSEATHGEIVIDEALRAAAHLEGELQRRDDVDLKGFGLTATYTVHH